MKVQPVGAFIAGLSSNSDNRNNHHVLSSSANTNIPKSSMNVPPFRNPEEIAKRFFPNGVPFPKARLEGAFGQMVKTREQWLDYNGSFVATDPQLLPSGGQRIGVTTDKDHLNLSFFADMGHASEQQETVFSGVSQYICQHPAEEHLIVGGGDWAYPHGPENDSAAETTRLANTVLTRAKPLAQQAPFIAVLGNHEYGDQAGPGDVAQFMNLAQLHNIEIPGRYFHYDISAPNWAVDLIVVDSSVMASDLSQQTWLKQTVDASLQRESSDQCPRWRVLITHHPLQSHGEHGDENAFLQELMADALTNVDLILAGHEHDVQFLNGQGANLPPTLICGTSSDSRSVSGGPDSEFHTSEASFATLEIGPSAMALNIRQVTKEDGAIFSAPLFSKDVKRRNV